MSIDQPMTNKDAIRKAVLDRETLYRSITINRADINPEERTIPASLSSEYEVERWFGKELLVHTPEAIDLSRAGDGGIPLLWNHDSDELIGRVYNIRLAGGKLRGDLKFSRNAEDKWQDVQDGVLRDVSIGYRILTWEESSDSDLVRVTRWELMEVSMTPVPADYTVGIGRSTIQPTSPMRGTSMPDHIDIPNEPETRAPVSPPAAMPPVAPVLADIRANMHVVRQDAERQAVAGERARVAAVNAAFDRPSLPRNAEFAQLRAMALSNGWSESQTNRMILDALGEMSEGVVDHSRTTDDMLGIHHEAPVQRRPQPHAPSAQVEADALDKFRAGAEMAVAIRAGLVSDREKIREAREGGFLGMSLLRLADTYLRHVNMDTRGMADDAIAYRAINTARNGQQAAGMSRAILGRASGMTTSDFTNILSGTANKALLMGWDQAPEVWNQFVRIGQVPDFKQAERVGLSGFSALEAVPADGDIKFGKFTDRKETIQAVSYAKKFRLTYQAIKNDDLSAFTAIPRGMGRAAQAIIGKMVMALLDGTGPTLNQDSTALWNTASHANYVASAAAPSVTTLDVAFAAMAKQTDPNSGEALNIQPKYLLVPKALESTARTLMAAQYDPGASPGSTSGKNIFAPNIYQNRLEIISDARLDAQTNGTAAWYLLSDPMIFDTLEVAFVDGVAEPYLREEQEWDTRGTQWVVGVDFGVSALDFRAMHKYKGNT